jgi:magnesium transporter
MEDDLQAYLITAFTDKELKAILDDLYMDDMVDLLEDLPANLVTRILDQESLENRALINTLLNYPPDSAGSIMTTEYVDLKKYNTVDQALAHIKEVGIHKETIYTCYVLERREILGTVSAKRLMISPDETTMEEIMHKKFISVSTTTDREDVAKLFSKYDLLAIPVVDSGGLMVGIVTVDDAMDVIEEEATEDITKMAAVTPSEDSYFDTSVLGHARNRFLWLLLLMLSATITGSIINSFEEVITLLPLLVSFIPMLMDTGGNCGSQSSTLVIRGIALDEIHFRDLFRIMFKEFRIALLVSIVLATVNGVRIMFLYPNQPKMAIVVALSLIATVVISKLIGCSLPLFAKKVKLDPAIMAAPLITTVVDSCSVFIFFHVVTYVFQLGN